MVAVGFRTTPCTSVFLPFAVPLGEPLPAPLGTGTGEPDDASAWWRMKALGAAVMENPAGRTPPVQAAWQRWEQELREAVDHDRRSAARGLGDRIQRMLGEQRRWLAELTQRGG